MKVRLTVVTLGVRSVVKSREFYCEGLGFRACSTSDEHLTLIDAGGVALALYDRKALAGDAEVPPAGSGFSGITLARNVLTKKDVDDALAMAKSAGATMLRPARDVFWGGYSGYFADPDGHVWEVAYNPLWPLDEDGAVVLPG